MPRGRTVICHSFALYTRQWFSFFLCDYIQIDELDEQQVMSISSSSQHRVFQTGPAWRICIEMKIIVEPLYVQSVCKSERASDRS